MQFNLTTILSLLVGLAGLLVSYMTGFLGAHPDVYAVLAAIQAVLGHFLGPAAQTTASAVKAAEVAVAPAVIAVVPAKP